MTQWTSDNRPKGGRPPGVRNRLSRAILNDLLADWREHGAQAIKLMRIERPADYVRAAISTLPKELTFDLHNPASSLSDDELDEMIMRLKRHMLTVSEDRPPLIEARIAEHEKTR